MKVLVLGAGQLARMMSLSATHLDIQVSAYDVGTESIIDPVTFIKSELSLAEAISQADAITAEFEHIPDDVLSVCERSGKFFPGAQAIKTGGDRAIEKALLERAKVPCAPYKIITEKSHFLDAISSLGLPLVVKTCQAGYDGKGQWRVKSEQEIEAIWSEMNAFLSSGTALAPHTIVAEQMIPFDREVSIIGVRSKSGEVKVYPLTENQHTHGVLTLSIAGKEKSEIQQQAEQAFSALSSSLNYVGVLAIEFFDVGGKLLVNEIAPRVHNSGHWTQQGCHASQFENHMRAVTGLPLGDTRLIQPTAMINVLGQSCIPTAVLQVAGTTSHWYGKSAKPGRKMGHINVSAKDLSALGDALSKLADILPEQDYPGVESTAKLLKGD
ncbi:5-(carboxyamino)imidazole ribonucleotide synthase [Pseudoalteromonas sp. T1lg65]|uniref:5-(carboxyamino)imidazole ribonucleotide synthase n=1 Tax=Pseudoalteromonas sp. T1lg65 TaxID=2077101 RepID=UPI003F79A582